MPYAEPVDLATLSPPAIAANLRATLARAERQLSALSLRRAARPLAPGKWSTQETVGHLIDSCFNNHQRLIRLDAPPGGPKEIQTPNRPKPGIDGTPRRVRGVVDRAASTSRR